MNDTLAPQLILTGTRIPKVTELYIRDWDDFAETKLEQLAQPSSMGKKLQRIAGIRLNQYIKDKPEIYSRVVSIGSLISSYLETLVSCGVGHIKSTMSKFPFSSGRIGCETTAD